ncbi:MAG: GNAT family N-acetyltransferase [Candidatus Omnitrophica bacterium]|nr:GNAT family N-acetyltransferase [Candidatus Omnitrophota bacterium]MDD5552865.1 GNAT family N-acetyltransferase [Candidatus Omnitrophota bacterium]
MIDIRTVSSQDLPSIAGMHMRLFEGDYSTSLGYDFVKNYYYGILLDGRLGFGLMAYEGDSPAGFIFGAYDHEKIKRLKLLPQAMRTFLCLITRPRQNYPWLKLFFKAKRSFVSPFKAELVSLCVKNEFQGRGIGRLLIRAFKDRLRSMQIRGCWTKTYSPEAARLYESEGFLEKQGFDFIGRSYRFYVWENKNG